MGELIEVDFMRARYGRARALVEEARRHLGLFRLAAACAASYEEGMPEALQGRGLFSVAFPDWPELEAAHAVVEAHIEQYGDDMPYLGLPSAVHYATMLRVVGRLRDACGQD